VEWISGVNVDGRRFALLDLKRIAWTGIDGMRDIPRGRRLNLLMYPWRRR
jgi:hypothetical protein